MAAISLIRADFAPRAEPEVPEPANEAMLESNIASYIRGCFTAAKHHRQTEQIEERMLAALRAIRGEYDAATLQDIKKFGGSEVYPRITASKVRGVAALLREIYTASDRPWAISPTPNPLVDGPSVDQMVAQLISTEIMELMASGMGEQVNDQMVSARRVELREKIVEGRRKHAEDAARNREHVLDDLLWEGGFYDALWEFLLDMATFPFAVIKGPVVRMDHKLNWRNGKPVMERVPSMHWERCSPFDVYFAPWSQHAQQGYILHRQRTTPSQLEALRGLPSYNTEAIDRILEANRTSGLNEWWDYAESQRADMEQRESETSPTFSGNAVDRPFPMLEYHGPLRVDDLRTWGMPEQELGTDSHYVEVTAYLVGNEVIGVRRNPHPAGRKPFYVDSFERVPGSIYGHAIPDLIGDIQSVAGATLRALVNNLAIASGPQVWVNEDRCADNDPNTRRLWPWKVWGTTDSISGNAADKPMDFFQPQSNAQELLVVYEKFAQMADELSSLPRYMQGNAQGLGGAGRTASGLSMLIEASNRTIKQTVASVDANIIEPIIRDLNVYVALTRPDLITDGDVDVVARGAVELVQRETLRMRRLEFLNITNNPVDMNLTGLEGRYAILREIARDLGLPTGMTMPNDPKQAVQNAMAAGMQGGGPGGQGQPGQPPAVQGGQGQPGRPVPQPQQLPPPAVEGVARPMAMEPGA